MLLLVFAALFPLTLLSFNLKTTVLNPTFFKQTFRQIDFYRRLVNIDPQKIVDYIAKKQGDSGGQAGISSKQIGATLTYIAPEDLQYTVEKNIDSYLASISKGEGNFSIDLTAIKKSVAKKGSDPQTKELLSQIPDSYTPVQTSQTTRKYFSFLPIGKILSYAGPVFVLLCLIFSIILWPSWRGRLRLIGIALLVFGGIILIGYYIANKIPIPRGIVADFLDDILRDILIAAKTKVLNLYLKESLSMVIAGLVLFVASFFIKSSQSSQIPKNQKTA